MSWFKRHLGLDFFDTAVHVVVTGFVIGFIDSTVFGRMQEGLMFAAFGSSVILFSIRRRFALKRAASAPIGFTTGQMAAERLQDLEIRVEQLESAEARVSELEERLDFAERMLARSGGERSLLEQQGRLDG